MEQYYEWDKEQIEEQIQVIQERIEQENLPIELYQGNEIYATLHIAEYLEEGIVASLAGSQYVLFELPMHTKPINIEEVIYQLKGAKKIPILAHPERYRWVQEDPNELLDLLEEGVLLQSNYGSILGLYGKEAQKTVKQLITHHMITFCGSDTHRPNSIYLQIPKAIQELKKWVSEEEVNNLTTHQAEKIILGEEIIAEEPEKIQKKFLGKWFS